MLTNSTERAEMNAHRPPDSPSAAPAGRVAGLIAANTSLLVAVLVYMGWAYDDAYLGYFHLNPLDLDVGIPEYILRSLDLFRQDLVVVAVLVVAITAAATSGIDGTALARRALTAASDRASRVPALRSLAERLPRDARPGTTGQAPPPQPATTDRGEPGQQAHRRIVIGAGAVITAIALLLFWIAQYTSVSTYLVLVLLAAGPVLLTWPNRGEHHGLFPYALAIVVAAVCALWATALYAHSAGTRSAQALVRDLPSRTEVVVYSMQRLALTGPGVTDQPLASGQLYRYEYRGLRLLIMRSGTYYLLPKGWHYPLDFTYVLTDSDQIRVVLLSG